MTQLPRPSLGLVAKAKHLVCRHDLNAMELNLKDVANGARSTASKSPKSRVRYISYGSEGDESVDRAAIKNQKKAKKRRQQVQALARDKRITSITLLPSSSRATKSNSVIIVENQEVRLKSAKSRRAPAQIEFSIKDGVKRSGLASSRTPRSARDSARRPPRPKVVPPLSTLPSPRPWSSRGLSSARSARRHTPSIASATRRRAGASQTPRAGKQRDDSTPLSRNVPKSPGNVFSSTRRRGNKLAPHPSTPRTLDPGPRAPFDQWAESPTPAGSDTPARSVGFVAAVTEADKRSGPERRAVGTKGPKMTLTRRLGGLRYAQTTHQNTPESASRRKPPPPAKGTFSRLLPYSNVTKHRSKTWTKHISKGSRVYD